ncbi:MAG: lipoprotein signal peptidase [Gammaproteobacteria bacterium]|nr:lipoprotein signal peptidase [Gammaproteobacteria bacterium]
MRNAFSIRHSGLFWLWVTLLVLIFDQWTKVLADSTLTLYNPVVLMPYFNLTLAYNEGAAFSFLSDAGGWQKWFFIILAILVCIVLVIWLSRLSVVAKWESIALSLVLGGAIGNVIDRFLYGHVIDFLDVYYESESCFFMFADAGMSCHWPAFNLADAAIMIGAVMLIIESFMVEKKEKSV